ncbi:helix-turn-helix domain-containing protein [Antarcticirhabdus aurantiaca]|uniref:Helix-turn-helix transcriptional regulator n=1 Tax=Antarcticirhabdus aurantiaca TaxID=2606717 RepID=A0ACD4NK96_9HYPH|nr:helix-turn-helix transcriptional regulator [Antarcticirhabdus aurantiaca]WAJ27125.1 helix-turn-helix transcriptional regulator [Jeongeuplla avenae]
MDATDASQVEAPKRLQGKRGNDHDRAIASMLRQARTSRGVSQPQLAFLIGCSFQQVQKYESGSNRISAGRLVSIARALKMDIAEFFGDLPALSSGPTLQAEELRFIRAYRSISAKQARSLDALVAALEAYGDVNAA